VCRLIPGYDFDEDKSDLYVYIIPEGLKDRMGAVCASLGTHANGEGVGLPALYKPYKHMDDKLERYFDKDRMYTLYIYLTQKKNNFMNDRRYREATDTAVYQGVSVAVIEQAMKSLCARLTFTDNPFHDKCAERHWVFMPPADDVTSSTNRLTEIANEEDFIEMLCILRTEPYTIPSLATLAAHRATPMRWTSMRRDVSCQFFLSATHFIPVDEETAHGTLFLNTMDFYHSFSMSTTVLIIIACILGVLMVILLGAVALGVWLVCHIFKELNGYTGV
jgi:hypothetical protein